MAIGTRLVMVFQDATNTDRTFSFGYIDPQASVANVKNVVQSIIDNGDIFANVPLTAKSAKLVTTTETDINIT